MRPTISLFVRRAGLDFYTGKGRKNQSVNFLFCHTQRYGRSRDSLILTVSNQGRRVAPSPRRGSRVRPGSPWSRCGLRERSRRPSGAVDRPAPCRAEVAGSAPPGRPPRDTATAAPQLRPRSAPAPSWRALPMPRASERAESWLKCCGGAGGRRRPERPAGGRAPLRGAPPAPPPALSSPKPSEPPPGCRGPRRSHKGARRAERPPRPDPAEQGGSRRPASDVVPTPRRAGGRGGRRVCGEPKQQPAGRGVAARPTAA